MPFLLILAIQKNASLLNLAKVGKFNSAIVNLSVTVTMVSEANLELTCSVSEESIFRNNTAF